MRWRDQARSISGVAKLATSAMTGRSNARQASLILGVVWQKLDDKPENKRQNKLPDGLQYPFKDPWQGLFLGVGRRMPTTRVIRSSLWVTLSLLSANAAPADVETLNVRRSGTDYSVSLAAVLDAPLARVWAVLTDYPRFHELSPSVTQSEIVTQLNRTTHRVRTRARVCVLIFCKAFNQVQTLEQRKLGELLIVVDPDESDFELGHARWLLFEDQRGTRVRFETRLRPAFWVPPLIGPWAMKRTLRKEAQATSNTLERLAQLGAP